MAEPSRDASSSRWWIAPLVLFVLFLLGSIGLGVGLGVSRGGRPGSPDPSPTPTPNPNAPIVLEAVGERWFVHGTQTEIPDPCSIDAARVRLHGARGTQGAVEGLASCLRARGVTVEVVE